VLFFFFSFFSFFFEGDRVRESFNISDVNKLVSGMIVSGEMRGAFYFILLIPFCAVDI
jgi:hypothetical protein